MSIKIYVKYVKNNRGFHTTKLNLPTGNLDEDTAMAIMDILEENVHQMNKCAVIVTHSNEIAKRADVIFRLKRGELKIDK